MILPCACTVSAVLDFYCNFDVNLFDIYKVACWFLSATVEYDLHDNRRIIVDDAEHLCLNNK